MLETFEREKLHYTRGFFEAKKKQVFNEKRSRIETEIEKKIGKFKFLTFLCSFYRSFDTITGLEI